MIFDTSICYVSHVTPLPNADSRNRKITIFVNYFTPFGVHFFRSLSYFYPIFFSMRYTRSYWLRWFKASQKTYPTGPSECQSAPVRVRINDNRPKAQMGMATSVCVWTCWKTSAFGQRTESAAARGFGRVTDVRRGLCARTFRPYVGVDIPTVLPE